MTGADAIEFIQKFWLQFLLTGISGGLALLCKTSYKKIKDEREQHKREQEEYNARPVSYTHLTLPTICSV